MRGVRDMWLYSLLVFLSGAICAVFFLFLMNQQTRLKDRSIDHVGDFLHKPDIQLFEELTDPVKEVIIRFPIFVSKKQAARQWRDHLEKVREQFRRFHNN